MDFPSGLILPVHTLLKRPIKCDSAGTRTILNTAAAMPAFINVLHLPLIMLGSQRLSWGKAIRIPKKMTSTTKKGAMPRMISATGS